MIRQGKFLVGAMVIAGCMLMVCKESPTTPPPADDGPLVGPAGSTVVFSDGFEGDLSKYETNYMINMGDFYSQMRIAADAAHTGTHSATSDSNRAALLYKIDRDTVSAISTGIAGVKFYIMAKSASHINFTVQIGKNAGSSGGLGRQFGIGFDKSDSIKTVLFNFNDMNPQQDSLLAPIQYNHWYKCVVEANFSTNKVTYSIDGVLIKNLDFPELAQMFGVDRLLVFRGLDGENGIKPCYVDDIVLYKR